MPTIAQTPEDVLLGEAGGKSRKERYDDMLAIASAVYNRSLATGVPVRDIISAPNQFSAYGKQLPAGVEAYRDLARQAFEHVAINGPVHAGAYYATPSAIKNLPAGLEPVTTTTGHHYFADPKGRAIATARGFVKPTVQAVSAVAGGIKNAIGTTIDGVAGLLTDGTPSQRAMTPAGRMGPITYDNHGKRSLVPSSGIVNKVAEVANQVMPGVRTSLYSGMEPTGVSPAGAPNRHPKGFAGDFDFYDPQTGRKVTDPVALHDVAMGMAAKHNANIGYGPEYMGAGRMHIDTMPLDRFPGGAQWASTAKGKWAANLDFARQTGIGPTPYTKAPTPYGPNSARATAQASAAAYREAANSMQSAGVSKLGHVPPADSTAPIGQVQRGGALPAATTKSIRDIAANYAAYGAGRMAPAIAKDHAPTPGARPAAVANTKVSPETYAAKVGGQTAAKAPNTFGKMLAGMSNPVYGAGQVAPASKNPAANLGLATGVSSMHKTVGASSTSLGSVPNPVSMPVSPPGAYAKAIAPQSMPQQVALPASRPGTLPTTMVAPQARPGALPTQMAAPLARPSVGYPPQSLARVAASLPQHVQPAKAATIQAPVNTATKAPATTVAPAISPANPGSFPSRPAAPKQGLLAAINERLDASKRAQWAAIGALVGGLPGAAIGGAFGPSLREMAGNMLNGGGATSLDKFSTGNGLAGIMAAMNGPRGATGTSLSNPGMSVTSLGNGMSERRSNKFGWTETLNAAGDVVGIRHDDPNKGIRGMLSNMLSGGGRANLSPAASAAIGAGRGGLY